MLGQIFPLLSVALIATSSAYMITNITVILVEQETADLLIGLIHAAYNFGLLLRSAGGGHHFFDC